VETSLEAFEAIFRATYDDLLRFAMRRVGPDSAADVVADVFLVAWRRRADIPADAPRLWLFGVASKVVSNHRRGELRRAQLLQKAAAEPAIEVSVDASTVVIERAFDTLTDPDREVLRLTEWERLSAGEAAVVLGCSTAAFRVRLHRARRRLAAAVLAAEPSRTAKDSQDVIA